MDKIVKDLKHEAHKCIIKGCEGYANMSSLEEGKLIYYCAVHFKQRGKVLA